MKVFLKLSYVLIPIALGCITLFALLVFLPPELYQKLNIVSAILYGINGWAFLIGLLSWFVSRKDQHELTSLQMKVRKYSLMAYIAIAIIISIAPGTLILLGLAGPS
jgi:hypothetical protein